MVRAAESDGGGCSAMSGARTEPIEIVINLPTPPSVNAIWRSGRRRVFRSKTYLGWIRAADAEILARRQMPKKRIEGPFTAHITLSQKVRGDIDNRIKGLLDFLQSREIIRNDSDCKRLTVERGEAEAGCRLTLREWRNAPVAEKGRATQTGANEMTKNGIVNKVLEGFRKAAERKLYLGEPHDPSPTCKVCHGTGWDRTEFGDGKAMQFKCACMWPKPN
jgi:Holliday junction resolvase RusA-like endonuclease